MKKKTVLIVEDELDMRIFISTLLETSGYQPIMTPGWKRRSAQSQRRQAGSDHFRCDDARRGWGSDVPAAKNR
jgi:CheY-like chemotaxis protein